MTWWPFNLEQVLIGAERFPMTAFSAKLQPQKCDLTHEFKGVSKKSGNAKSAMRKPYKHNAFPILSGPFLARGS